MRPPRLRGGRLLATELATLVVVLTLLVALSTTPLLEPVHLWLPGNADPVVHRVDAGTGQLPVFVTPQRPGWNLVLLPGEDSSVDSTDPAAGTNPGAGTNPAVGTDPQRLQPATRRPGAAGSWALVELPEGFAQLWIQWEGARTRLTVRTGRGTGPDLRGPDGPECASAQLGRAVAGAPALARCPADHLAEADRAALRATVGFLAARGHRALTLVSDGSPRSRAAAAAVRAAAGEAGATVRAPGAGSGPVLVVAGWQAAESALYDIAAGELAAEGAYLAPWLLSPPLLSVPAGQLLVLPYQPGGALPGRYAAALGAAAPGAAATGSGYAAWLSTQGSARDGAPAGGSEAVRLYAPAVVNFDLFGNAGGTGHDHGPAAGSTEWLPGGRLTAVTGPLPPPR